MKRLVVGGNFTANPKEKKSSIAKKLSVALFADLFNGGTVDQVESARDLVSMFDLTVWMPNIDNEVEKNYPVKKPGSVLICSKLVHDERTMGDAVSRIFRMNANAVIAIYKEYYSNHVIYRFKLVDSLGNLWIDTTSVEDLASTIEKLAVWSKGSIRTRSVLSPMKNPHEVSEAFCEIVKKVSDKVEKQRGGRYFGNASTRCSYMFPSERVESPLTTIKVSGRNTPKDCLKPEDFVSAQEHSTYKISEMIRYCGHVKPSVDTPVQLELYKAYPQINFMIHGHAYVKEAFMTEHYYPCGDLREVEEVREILDNELTPRTKAFVINLKNHGFLMGATDLKSLKHLVNSSEFIYRELEEKIEE